MGITSASHSIDFSITILMFDGTPYSLLPTPYSLYSILIKSLY
ncbi:hypothetical protein [Moorena sp. SIO1F2]